MKHLMRSSALTCVIIFLAVGLSTSPATASDNNHETVRAAQMRLASLGYYVGHYDGVMGSVTKSAIKEFQHNNGLDETGHLTAMTYNMLLDRTQADNRPVHYVSYPHYDNMYRDVSDMYHDGYEATTMRSPVISWENRWHYAHTESFPMRYSKLEINEDNQGALHHYAVTVNGHPVLFANNQPGVLRVSQTYALKNEDAIIFTAYHGDAACPYKNYLLTVHSDGSFTAPREIGNCAGNYEAHVASNSLLVSFQGGTHLNGWSTWDVWRYEDNTLARL